MCVNQIVLLAGEWDTTPLVYNFLKENFNVKKVIIEKPVPRKVFLQKRIKKLGWLQVGGQILFQVIIAKYLKKTSAKRIKDILQQYHLSENKIPATDVVSIPSVNSDECLNILQDIRPTIVIVHGTRIISKKILQNIKADFINIHAGITPRYRGSHGAYWALANGDKENCGVTVHLVDAGIDTGNILFQQNIEYTEEDNFITYPYLQLAEGLNLLKKTLALYKMEKLEKNKNILDSRLWHHPTLWSYILTRIKKGVK